MEINDMRYNVCRKFKYLGSMVNDQNEMDVEITARIAAANRCYYSLQNTLGRRSISTKTKLKIYSTIIKPIVLYGCEAWTLTKSREQRLYVFENSVLRKIFGAVFDNEEQAWRRRHNNELREMPGQLNIVDVIRSRRLQYAGHVARMEEGRIPKKVMVESIAGGRRFPGRPRKRWIDNVKRNLEKCWS